MAVSEQGENWNWFVEPATADGAIIKPSFTWQILLVPAAPRLKCKWYRKWVNNQQSLDVTYRCQNPGITGWIPRPQPWPTNMTFAWVIKPRWSVLGLNKCFTPGTKRRHSGMGLLLYLALYHVSKVTILLGEIAYGNFPVHSIRI